ncbi:MAG: hypothetical protein JXQ96_21770 [Cyclobacteriaceae bacterium]
MQLKYSFLIASVLLLNFGCTTTTNSKETRRIALDTTLLIEKVAEDIISELNGQVILESGFVDGGDYYIEFHPDTTNADPADLIKESYTIQRESIKTGLLNNDDIYDFAIQSIWSPVSGNMYGLQWHILTSTDNSWKLIANSFGGDKFSSIENISEIKESKISTELIEFDEDQFLHSDSTITRTFILIGDTLTEE